MQGQNQIMLYSKCAVEFEYIKSGHFTIIGCDEAGRGPLAGPVVAAAVVFSDCSTIWKCRDSKSVSQARREETYEEIITNLCYSFSIVSSAEIDNLNIRVASLKAMSDAVRKLDVIPDAILIDGRDTLPEFIQSHAIVKGDSKVSTISAASIVAKVIRDRLMLEYDRQFPEYGFGRHFGYPTEFHRKALIKHGPCPIHRKTFKGVKELL